LINFYVRLLSFHKDFLDNSSGGSFTSRRADDAWGLLDLVSENTDNWDLGKGKFITIDYVMRVELNNALDLGLRIGGRGRQMNSKVGI
jgi:hypothetical protein